MATAAGLPFICLLETCHANSLCERSKAAASSARHKGDDPQGGFGPLGVSGGRKRADGAPPPASNPQPSKPAEPAKPPTSDKGEGKKGGAVPAAVSKAAEAKPDEGKKRSHEPVLIVFGLTEKGLPQGSWFSGVDAEVAIRSAQLMKLRAIKVTSQAQRDLLGQLRQGQVFASDRLFAPIIQRPLYEALLQAAGDPKGDEASGTEAPKPRAWPEIKAGSVVLATEDPKGGWWDAVVVEAGDNVLQLRWIIEPRSAAFVRPRGEVGLMPAGT